MPIRLEGLSNIGSRETQINTDQLPEIPIIPLQSNRYPKSPDALNAALEGSRLMDLRGEGYWGFYQVSRPGFGNPKH